MCVIHVKDVLDAVADELGIPRSELPHYGVGELLDRAGYGLDDDDSGRWADDGGRALD